MKLLNVRHIPESGSYSLLVSEAIEHVSDDNKVFFGEKISSAFISEELFVRLGGVRRGDHVQVRDPIYSTYIHPESGAEYYNLSFTGIRKM